jgi:hypothetical protein
MLRPTVSRSVYFGFKPRLGLKTGFLLRSDSCGFVHVGRRLWREDGSVVWNCCWSSSAQSFTAFKISIICNLYLQFYIPYGHLLFTVLHVFLVLCIYNIYNAWNIRSCPNSCSSRYNGWLVTWTVVRLTASKLKALIYSLSGFIFADVTNICVFMILFDLCLLPTQFHYVVKYTVLGKPCATRGPVRPLEFSFLLAV